MLEIGWNIGFADRRFNTALPNRARALVEQDAVDIAGLKEEPRRLGAAFYQQRGNTTGGECREKLFRMVGVAIDDFDAGCFEGLAAGV